MSVPHRPTSPPPEGAAGVQGPDPDHHDHASHDREDHACDHGGAGGHFARAGLTERRRLLITLLTTASILCAEVVGGIMSGSLALLSDAGHMATDVGALLLSLVACTIATRPPDARRTYGFHRLEVLSALVNGVLLFGVAGYILYEAYQRLQAPAPVRTTLMLGVAAVGLAGNLVGVWLLHGQRSLNVRGAYLHVLTDTLSSVGVLVGGAIMAVAQGAYIVDPILGGLIGLTILWGAYSLVRDAVHVLLEAAPSHIDLPTLVTDLQSLDDVEEVHDLHVWTIASGLHALSAHVVVRAEVLTTAGGHDRVLHQIKELLLARHDIAHSTVQLETVDYTHVGVVH